MEQESMDPDAGRRRRLDRWRLYFAEADLHQNGLEKDTLDCVDGDAVRQEMFSDFLRSEVEQRIGERRQKVVGDFLPESSDRTIGKGGGRCRGAAGRIMVGLGNGLGNRSRYAGTACPIIHEKLGEEIAIPNPAFCIGVRF
jgi:hypothetical protein